MRNLIILIAWILLSVPAFSQRHYRAEYQGEKAWTPRGYRPHSSKIILEIKDSCAYIHDGEWLGCFLLKEKGDDWVYQEITKAPFKLIMRLSKDLTHLQVGEPKEQTFFYKRIESNVHNSIKTKCNECGGSGIIYCPMCAGTGRVPPNPKGGPDDAVGICPKCHGLRCLKISPCQNCNGTGQITISE